MRPHVCNSLTAASSNLFPSLKRAALSGGSPAKPRGRCTLLMGPEELLAIEKVWQGIAKLAAAIEPLRSSRCSRASLALTVRSYCVPSLMSHCTARSPACFAERATRPVPENTSASVSRATARRAPEARGRSRRPSRRRPRNGGSTPDAARCGAATLLGAFLFSRT